MSTVLILGANSDMAKATAEVFAANGHNLVLALRDTDRIVDFKNELIAKHGIECTSLAFDIMNTEQFNKDFNALQVLPKGVVCCVGYLGNEEEAQQNREEAHRINALNFEKCKAALDIVIEHYKVSKGGGFL